MYLSQKTLDKKEGRAGKKPCSKCNKLFTRLETHLRKNAFCKSIEQPEEASSGYQSTIQIESDQHGDSLPQESTQTTISTATSTCTAKPTLNLPASEEEWSAANSFFHNNLVPAVLLEEGVDNKNSVLVEDIYSYFSNRYGVKNSSFTAKKRQEVLNKHDRALKKVKQLRPQLDVN